MGSVIYGSKEFVDSCAVISLDPRVDQGLLTHVFGPYLDAVEMSNSIDLICIQVLDMRIPRTFEEVHWTL
jgi:hypothetical protein